MCFSHTFTAPQDMYGVSMGAKLRYFLNITNETGRKKFFNAKMAQTCAELAARTIRHEFWTWNFEH